MATVKFCFFQNKPDTAGNVTKPNRKMVRNLMFHILLISVTLYGRNVCLNFLCRLNMATIKTWRVVDLCQYSVLGCGNFIFIMFDYIWSCLILAMSRGKFLFSVSACYLPLLNVNKWGSKPKSKQTLRVEGGGSAQRLWSKRCILSSKKWHYFWAAYKVTNIDKIGKPYRVDVT